MLCGICQERDHIPGVEWEFVVVVITYVYKERCQMLPQFGVLPTPTS
jgi:hypothetical protein